MDALKTISSSRPAALVVSSIVSTALQQSLSTTAAHRALTIGRGGGAQGVSLSSISTNDASSNEANEESLAVHALRGGKAQDDLPSKGFIPPEARAVLNMATAMALHYLGYSFARPTTLAIFTSEKTGFANNPAAFPLAMALVSPTALMLLIGYGRVLEAFGPRGTLKRTTIFCAAVVASTAALISFLSKGTHGATGASLLLKLLSGGLFVFRESYVQLLTSQYWSFMVSILTPSQSSTWFAPIAGLTSLSSVTAGVLVSKVVDKVGLTGTLGATGLSLLLSVFAAMNAYEIAEKFGFNPEDEIKKGKGGKKKDAQKKEHDVGMVRKASDLFARVPTLWALFLEVLSSQGLATLMNVIFVAKLSSAIPDDAERAGWMGKFYALVNLISSAMQFTVLPPLMSVIEPRVLWRVMPMVVLLFSSFQSLEKDPSLYTVSASLLAMKALEYSVRRMLDEMVYVPLDFESRYVGKEVIGVFGYRLGKSSMSLILSGLTSIFGHFELQQLSLLTTGVACLWLSNAWRLSNYVPTKMEAQKVYMSNKAQKKR